MLVNDILQLHNSLCTLVEIQVGEPFFQERARHMVSIAPDALADIATAVSADALARQLREG